MSFLKQIASGAFRNSAGRRDRTCKLLGESLEPRLMLTGGQDFGSAFEPASVAMGDIITSWTYDKMGKDNFENGKFRSVTSPGAWAGCVDQCMADAGVQQSLTGNGQFTRDGYMEQQNLFDRLPGFVEASNNLRKKLQLPLSAYHVDMGIHIPNPCAGKPEPCGVDTGDQSLKSVVKFKAGADLAAKVNKTIPVGGGMLHVFADFSEFGAESFAVEVLLGETVVAHLPQIDDEVLVSCASCGANEHWPVELGWVQDDTPDGETIYSARFATPRTFIFSGGISHIGDGLRFIALSVEGVSGVINHSLTTIDIPELHILEMSIGDIPEPDPCPGDVTGAGGAPDAVVDGLDLLLLLSSWGACDPSAGECPADLTGAGGSPDDIVDGLDLLLLLSSWGPCS